MKFNPFGGGREIEGRGNVVHLNPNLGTKNAAEAIIEPDVHDVVTNVSEVAAASTLSEKILSRHLPHISPELEKRPLIDLIQELLPLARKIETEEDIALSEVALASTVKNRLDRVFRLMGDDANQTEVR